jgi:hypothetical protein
VLQSTNAPRHYELLAGGTTYKAVVTTKAKDLAGNQLDQNDTQTGLQQKAWLFTCATRAQKPSDTAPCRRLLGLMHGALCGRSIVPQSADSPGEVAPILIEVESVAYRTRYSSRS